jgi:hypothetical protein
MKERTRKESLLAMTIQDHFAQISKRTPRPKKKASSCYRLITLLL